MFVLRLPSASPYVLPVATSTFFLVNSWLVELTLSRFPREIRTADIFTMRVGVSLSPGGLLLPYHLGVLDSLEYNGFVTPETPIAGSSAGAIATAAYACGVDSKTALECTIEISDRCKEMGGARGRLAPLLLEKLKALLGEEQFFYLQERPGDTAIAYREVFPFNRPILQSTFEDIDDLIRAVSHSSTFPFFTTNWPVALDTSKKMPRLVVDGFFSVPRSSFGCPDFRMAGIELDRVVSVSPFPKDSIGLDASTRENCISPEEKGGDQLVKLLRLATQPTSREELTAVYEEGWTDAERWYREHGRNVVAVVENENAATLN